MECETNEFEEDIKDQVLAINVATVLQALDILIHNKGTGYKLEDPHLGTLTDFLYWVKIGLLTTAIARLSAKSTTTPIMIILPFPALI